MLSPAHGSSFLGLDRQVRAPESLRSTHFTRSAACLLPAGPVRYARSTPRDRSRSEQVRDSRQTRLRCDVSGPITIAHGGPGVVGGTADADR